MPPTASRSEPASKTWRVGSRAGGRRVGILRRDANAVASERQFRGEDADAPAIRAMQLRHGSGGQDAAAGASYYEPLEMRALPP